MISRLLQRTEPFNVRALPSGQCHGSLGISDVLRYTESSRGIKTPGTVNKFYARGPK